MGVCTTSHVHTTLTLAGARLPHMIFGGKCGYAMPHNWILTVFNRFSTNACMDT